MSVMQNPGFAAVLLVSILAGCTSTGNDGGDGGVLGAALRGGGGQDEQPEVVQGDCPQVNLREGTAYFRTHESGGEGDPSRVVHQASIAQVTRQCTLSGGEVVINVVAAGRVVTGPAGGPGTVELPIRVAAVRGDEVLYSELTEYSTTIEQASGQFLFSDPAVRIPAADADNVQIYVGFDEGPYDTP